MSFTDHTFQGRPTKPGVWAMRAAIAARIASNRQTLGIQLPYKARRHNRVLRPVGRLLTQQRVPLTLIARISRFNPPAIQRCVRRSGLIYCPATIVTSSARRSRSVELRR